MKFAVFFLLCSVALAAAAPQFWPWAGVVAPAAVAPAAAYVAPLGRTVVAGPTVVNGFGAHYVAPGYVGTAYV